MAFCGATILSLTGFSATNDNSFSEAPPSDLLPSIGIRLRLVLTGRQTPSYNPAIHV
jgi:hypothetical protein